MECADKYAVVKYVDTGKVGYVRTEKIPKLTLPFNIFKKYIVIGEGNSEGHRVATVVCIADSAEQAQLKIESGRVAVPPKRHLVDASSISEDEASPSILLGPPKKISRVQETQRQKQKAMLKVMEAAAKGRSTLKGKGLSGSRTVTSLTSQKASKQETAGKPQKSKVTGGATSSLSSGPSDIQEITHETGLVEEQQFSKDMFQEGDILHGLLCGIGNNQFSEELEPQAVTVSTEEPSTSFRTLQEENAALKAKVETLQQENTRLKSLNILLQEKVLPQMTDFFSSIS